MNVGFGPLLLEPCFVTFDVTDNFKPKLVSLTPMSGFAPAQSNNAITLTTLCDDPLYHGIITKTAVSLAGKGAAMCISWGDPHFRTFDVQA